MDLRTYWDRYRERRSRERALEAEIKAELKAEGRERNMQLLQQYGPIVATSVGAGIFAAVITAIASHSTREAWLYANMLEGEGYPPIWFWAGLAGAMAAAGIVFRRSR